jgi:EpsI family protein
MSDRLLKRRAVVAAVLMAAAAATGQVLIPTRRMADMRRSFKLETLMPATFGDWHVDTTTTNGIVNPETAAILNRIYSQLLDRVYLNSTGSRIMVSIAYGDDQSDDSVQMHFPEVCYPAQGFQLQSNKRDILTVPNGTIKVRRLVTQFGDSRHEPVTYWTIIGDRQSLGGVDKKISEIEHGFKGEIVDGLLFRVSSINPDTAAGFQEQDQFVRDLVVAMSPAARLQLVGLG